ncbi:uracil-DNA glycosylase family 4 [Mumia flava]|uniref:Type-5 uracil-DNA glycosylase n=1 Tax=Mumia flava TaxID=1348852 RepID=A0A2M9BFW8_9ACTN|nr:uracil-DNA glycosylase family 4 [Mumia flava]
MTPGSGWPDDPATARTPVAADADAVARLSDVGRDLAELDARVSVCRACPRLVDWREDVAVTKRRAFADESYWGRPIPGWGDAAPRFLVVGLAPAAHGGNRTGRIFTGDRSGDWLFASLHRVGLAVQETSTHAGDGQRLLGGRMVAAVRCAPPANKPTVAERDTCAPWLEEEIRLVEPSVRAIVALGAYGWEATLRTFASLGVDVGRPRPRFGHGAETTLPKRSGGTVTLLGCFHPSQQNTFTGRLTEPMLDAVMTRAKEVSDD